MNPPPGLTHAHQRRSGNVPDGLLTTERRKDRLVAGVCSGIAARYDVDPLLVRVAFVLLGLSLGVGIVLYAFCWLWMTEEGATEPLIHQQVPSSRGWPWAWVVASLVIACIIGMIVLGSFFPFGPMPAMILLGVWLWARHTRRKAAGDPLVYFTPGEPARVGPPKTQFDSASMAWRSRLEAVYLSNEPLPLAPPQPLPVFDPYAEPAPAPAAAVPAKVRNSRRPSWVATLVMWAVAAAAFTGVHLLGPEGEFRWMLPSAAALGVVGLFLLVGSSTRRPRLAIITGLVLVVTMFGSMASPWLEPIGPSGTQVYSSTMTLPQTIDVRYRRTTLDLSQVELTRDQTLALNATAASVTLIPPPGTIIEYDLEGGVIRQGGKDVGGGTDSGVLDLGGAGGPTLIIKLVARGAEVDLP